MKVRELIVELERPGWDGPVSIGLIERLRRCNPDSIATVTHRSDATSHMMQVFVEGATITVEERVEQSGDL